MKSSIFDLDVTFDITEVKFQYTALWFAEDPFSHRINAIHLNLVIIQLSNQLIAGGTLTN